MNSKVLLTHPKGHHPLRHFCKGLAKQTLNLYLLGAGSPASPTFALKSDCRRITATYPAAIFASAFAQKIIHSQKFITDEQKSLLSSGPPWHTDGFRTCL
jgi:hypothetical protein